MFQKIIKKLLNRERNNPIAIQCLWNSDYDYIGLTIEIVFKENNSYRTKEIIEIDYKNYESTEAMAIEAKKIANEYVEKYGIELYFPSPDKWSRDCPNWWEYKLSPKCEDCKTPIIPTDSKYLPKEVCYPCHLKRESNKQIINAEPYDGGVTMYLSKDDEYDNIGYCSNFEDFTIAPFINDKVQQQLTEKAISIVTLDKSYIMELNQVLETELNRKLEKYVKPEIDDQMSRFVKTRKVSYNGIEYELADRFNNYHNEISNLIYSLQTNQKAIINNYEYKIYFKNGITHRDDTILRFVNYTCKGVSDIKSINEQYKKILTETEVAKTIKKLNEIGCIDIKENIITITKTGMNIV